MTGGEPHPFVGQPVPSAAGEVQTRLARLDKRRRGSRVRWWALRPVAAPGVRPQHRKSMSETGIMEQAPRVEVVRRRRSAIGRYALAVLPVLVAVAVKSVLGPLGRERPFLLLNGAVVFAAWFGGRGPAVTAVALAAAAADFFFLPPYGTFTLTAESSLQLAVFIAEAALVGAITLGSRGAAERSRRAEEQLRKLNRAHRALSTCNDVLIHAGQEQGLLQKVCTTIVEIAGYRMCWVGRAEHDLAKTVRPVAQAGYEGGYLATVRVTWADTERGRGPTGTAVRTGRPSIQEDVAGGPSFAPWRAAAMERGYGSVIALPLQLDGQAFGALTIYAAEPRAFDDDAVRLLVELSEDLAYGIKTLRLRARVEAERARFESVLMQAPVAVGVYSGSDHVVRLANPRWFALGKNTAEPIGKPLREVLPEAVEQGVIAQLDEVYATGEPREIKAWPIEYRRAAGAVETRSYDVALQPLHDPDGSVGSIVAVISDVTDHAAARRALEEARAAAEEASRAKDEFLRIASHELRTPLTPLLAWAQSLAKPVDRDPERLDRGLAVILRSARAEARIVEDLIDVSHIVAGRLRMEMRPTELGSLVQVCVDEARPAAAAKGVEIDVSMAPDTEVVGDARRLQQVARNLLSNALKFTPRGGRVSVEIAREPGSVLLRVRDTGKGIPAGELARVFERFRPGDASMTRAEGGLGLGLSIVKHIVEAHAGTVHAESAGEGRGATLVVDLPVVRAGCVEATPGCGAVSPARGP